jgi:hypothetical protein
MSLVLLDSGQSRTIEVEGRLYIQCMQGGTVLP